MSALAPWASLLQSPLFCPVVSGAGLALLQVLNAGRLTDGQGNEVDFRNVIIIMTSNIGAKNIVQKIRESSLDFAVSRRQVNKDEEIRNDVMRDLKKVMSPELINRIDSVIVFQQLAKEQVRSITFPLQSCCNL